MLGRGTLVGALSLLVASLAVAQAGGANAARYGGVVPGADRVPAHVQAAQTSGARLLTWPGFQMRPDGASRVFIQTSSSVQFESRQGQRRFELILRNTSVHGRNNARPLESQYFNSPVARTTIERRGKDVAIVLKLRADVTPAVRSETSPSGFHYVFLEFPAGDYPHSDG